MADRCAHGVTIGASCGGCLKAERHAASWRAGLDDAIAELETMRNDARELTTDATTIDDALARLEALRRRGPSAR